VKYGQRPRLTRGVEVELEFPFVSFSEARGTSSASCGVLRFSQFYGVISLED